jgi:hypothetical protein
MAHEIRADTPAHNPDEAPLKEMDPESDPDEGEEYAKRRGGGQPRCRQWPVLDEEAVQVRNNG